MTITACEALATKAEVQELRNQINQLLGKKEGGGWEDVLLAGSLLPITILGNGLLLAEKSIQDIKIQGLNLATNADDMAKAFADGSAQMIKVTGSKSTQTPLPDLSTLARNTSAKAVTTSAVAGAAATATAATMGTVASLGLSVVSLGLAIKNRTDIIELEAEQQATEKTLQLHEQEFGNLNKVIGKYGEKLSEAQEDITKLETELTETNANSQVLQQNITTQQLSIQILEDNVAQSEQTVNKVLEDLATTQADLEKYKADAGEQIDILQTNVGVLQKNFEQQKEATQTMYEVAEKQGIRIASLEGGQTVLLDKIEKLQLTQSVTKAEMDVLIEDLQLENTLEKAKSTRLSARLTVLEKNASKKDGGGGTNVNVVSSLASTQINMLEAMNKLGTSINDADLTIKPLPEIEDITEGSLLNGDTEYFDQTFQTLYDHLPVQNNKTQTQEVQVTPAELETWGLNFKDLIKDDVETVVAAVVAATITPYLNQISSQTQPSAISNAVGQEICNQTQNPDSCVNTGIVNPINTNTNNLPNVLGAAGGGAAAAEGAIILQRLQQLQEFLERAWNNTKMDKILNFINTILALHNAYMLSRDLKETIGEVASEFLNLVGIKNHEGDDIDVNEWINNKLKTMIEALIGADNAAALGKGIKAANRILVAARGMVSAVTAIKDALQEGQEIIANRLGTLGNALMEHGYFEDGYYDFMTDDNDFRTPFSKYINYISGVKEIVEEIGELIEAGLEIKEGANEFNESKQAFSEASKELQDTMEKWLEDKNEDDVVKKEESESPIIENIHLTEAPPEE